jgi:hypothetical protein
MKKSVALLLAAVLLVTLLSGCGEVADSMRSPKISTGNGTESSQQSDSSPLPVEGNDSDVEMQSVDSTCFSEVGYDPDGEILYVRFLDSGSLYSYQPVSQDEYDDFMQADSLGSYYNDYIKGQYECHRLE